MEKAKRLTETYWFRYTACFLVFAILIYGPLALAGKSLIWSVDGLEMTYPFFVYEGTWIRSIFASFVSGSPSLPMWDMSIGFGSDIQLTVGTNPFNALSALFPERYSELGMTLVAFLEMYLAGMFFSLYAFQHGKSRSSALAGSMMYVFSAWMITAAMRQHTFLVPMVLFPLLLMGADRVFNKRSPLLFIVAVALFFWTYFYLAYMACIALFFYCVYCFARYEPNRSVLTFLKWVLIVAALIVVGALIAGVAMLPTVMNVLGQGRLGVSRVIPLLYGPATYAQFVLGFVAFGSAGMDAFIGFGGLGFLGCVLLFLQKGRRSLKVAFIGATAMMLIPYFGHLFNGFSYVTNRWAWIYTFLVSFVFAEMLPSMIQASKKEYGKLAIAACCFGVFITVFSNTRSAAGYASFGIMLLFIVAALMGLFDQRANAGAKGFAKALKSVDVAVVALLAVSLAVPSFFWMHPGARWADAQTRLGSAYQSQVDSPSALLKDIDDPSVWRYDRFAVPVPRNNNMLQQLDGYDYYTPLYYEDLDHFLEGLNLSTMRFSHFILGLDRRGFVEAALGAKYFLTDEEKADCVPYGFGHAPVMAGGDDARYGVYENSLNLPVAYFTDATVGADYYESLPAVKKQQVICQAVVLQDAGIGENRESEIAFTDKDLDFEITASDEGVEIRDGSIVTTSENCSIELSFSAPGNAETYILLESLDYQNPAPSLGDNVTLGGLLRFARDSYKYSKRTEAVFEVVASNGFATGATFLTRDHHMYTGKDSALFNLGYNEEPLDGAVITFAHPGVYAFDELAVISQPMDNLASGVEGLRKQEVELAKGVNSFTASVSAEEDGVLCLTVPWSAGWSAYVDGKPATIVKANEAFLGVALDRGRHEVEFTYQSPWLREGAIMTVAGFVCLLLIVVVRFAIVRGRRRGRHTIAS